MDIAPRPEDKTELEQLLRCVESVDNISLPELDGFCISVAVCPQIIPFGEWFAHIWPEHSMPTLPSSEQQERLIALCLAHYNDVANALTPPEVQCRPIFAESAIGWKPWIRGFERAMRLRPDAWAVSRRTGSEHDKYISRVMGMMIMLYDIARGYTAVDTKLTRMLNDRAIDLIPGLVYVLNAWNNDVNEFPVTPPPAFSVYELDVMREGA